MEFTRKSQPEPLYDSILKKHLALNNIIFNGTVELFQSVFETVGLTLLFSVIIKPYYFAVILRSSCCVPVLDVKLREIIIKNKK
jgi:hypothetical protein